MSSELIRQSRNNCRFFDDFFEFFSVGTANVESGRYTIGGVNTELVTITSAPDGILSLVTGGADDDTAEVQTKVAYIKLEASKKYSFETKISSTTANADTTQHEWGVGLYALDTTLMGAGVDSATDMLCIQKDDGDNNVDLLIRQASGTIQRVAAIATWTVATFTTIRFEVDVSPVVGTGTVRVWINDQPVVLSGGSYDLVSTVLPTTVPLSPSLLVGGGIASTATLLVDYIDVIWPRAA